MDTRIILGMLIGLMIQAPLSAQNVQTVEAVQKSATPKKISCLITLQNLKLTGPYLQNADPNVLHADLYIEIRQEDSLLLRGKVSQDSDTLAPVHFLADIGPSDSLNCTVWDWDALNEDDFMSSFTLYADSLRTGGPLSPKLSPYFKADVNSYPLSKQDKQVSGSEIKKTIWQHQRVEVGFEEVGKFITWKAKLPPLNLPLPENLTVRVRRASWNPQGKPLNSDLKQSKLSPQRLKNGAWSFPVVEFATYGVPHGERLAIELSYQGLLLPCTLYFFLP